MKIEKILIQHCDRKMFHIDDDPTQKSRIGTLILSTFTTLCLQSRTQAGMGAVRYAHSAHAG